MRKAVFILEAINALLGIIISMQRLDFLGLSVATWNAIVFWVFVAGFVGLFWSDKDIERKLYNNIYSQVKASVRKDLATLNQQKGSLDSVTQADRELIMSWAIKMIYEHGHMDVEGLLADRASGIRLNELMSRNCLRCGKPRNQQSTEDLDDL